jgi:hypothetical protein
VLLATSLILAFAQTPSVQPSDYQTALLWYKDRGEVIRAELLQELRHGLTPAQARGEAEINYRIFAENGNTSAYATRLEGDRVVDIGAGLLQVLDWVATAVGGVGAFPSGATCAEAYIPYLADGIRENSRRGRRRAPLVPVAAFFTYAQTHRDTCRGITETSYRARQRADKARAIAFAASFKFLLAHEMSHHLLGHVRELPRSLSTSEVRQQETDTDKLALKLLVKTGTNPIQALPLLLLFGALEDWSVLGGDHPATVDRFKWAWDAALAILKDDPEFEPALRKSGEWEGWTKAVALLKERFDELSDEPELPLSAGLDSREKACLERFVHGCMRDCMVNYGNSRAECRDNLCAPGKGSNGVWESRCRAEVR